MIWFTEGLDGSEDTVFSVSQPGLGKVCKYIAEQEKHHQVRTWDKELKDLVDKYGLKWIDWVDEEFAGPGEDRNC